MRTPRHFFRCNLQMRILIFLEGNIHPRRKQTFSSLSSSSLSRMTLAVSLLLFGGTISSESDALDKSESSKSLNIYQLPLCLSANRRKSSAINSTEPSSRIPSHKRSAEKLEQMERNIIQEHVWRSLAKSYEERKSGPNI